MGKVKHAMNDNGTTVCGRAIEVNGNGADCKNCTARAARNAARVAAGHGEDGRALYTPAVAVEVIPPALTDEVIAAHGMDATDIAEYNMQRSADIEAAVLAAQKAITNNGRVFLAEAHNWGGVAVFDALVASGWADLITDGDMSRYVRRTRVQSQRGQAANSWGPCGPCDGTDAPMARSAHPCGLMKDTPIPTVDDVAAMADTENWFNKIVELSEQTIRAEQTDPNQVAAPEIPGYYWTRHNGHTSVENGPTVRTTDTYQLRRAEDGRVMATISHKAGFRWVPSGCWFISTLLCESWDGVSLADAFDRIKTYVRECEWAYTGDHYARMSAGDNARKGQPFTSRDDVRQGVCEAIEASGTCAPAGDHFDVERIVDTIVAYYGRVSVDTIPTPDFWHIVQGNAIGAPLAPVGTLNKPTRTKVAKRARKALKRKHKASTVHQR